MKSLPGAGRLVPLVFIAALTLSSCGGGGDGGGSSSSSSSGGGHGDGLRFDLDPASFSFDYVDTAQHPYQRIVATA